ncbi:hypothetical protein SDC9_46949 [bioreactor metagenome]|uniref:DUF4760 domain-containing protein n=1 Tax=bioreactor metagenome TaxID=1076179 RepID=A0A644WAW2_9ZZZZ
MQESQIVLISIGVATISAIAAAISAWLTYSIAKRSELNDLEKNLDDILKIGIEYPYLESKRFTIRWNELKDTDDERYLRYDMFCNLVFNYIHKVYQHFNGDKSKIESYVDIKSWVRLHEQNWRNPIDPHENIDGYDEKFRIFINSYIN